MDKYLIKKCQKIVSAIYLVTSNIKDEDSMKWRVREEAMSFISIATMFSSTSVERESNTQAFFSSSNTLIYLLNTAFFAGLLSKMNSSIIIHEIESIVQFINKENELQTQLPGYILSDNFFQDDQNDFLYKGHDSTKKTLNIVNSITNNKDIFIKDRKNIRQENIIGLLKKNSNLTIKDFVKVIKDCSEKTIQRELINLVKKGLIKRQGERRWSTYSLV